MVKLGLQLECSLENAGSLKPNEDKQWHLMVKCTSCQEEHGKPVVCMLSDEVDMPGSRGHANMVMKCHFCGKSMSLNFEEKSVGEYTADDIGPKIMVTVECRGMEVIGWNPADDYTVTCAESSTQFKQVSLEEEFYDYDEESGQPVSVSEIKTSVVRV